MNLLSKKKEKKIIPTFHNSIETLEFRTFLKIGEKNDLNLLTISGQPTAEQLLKAWDKILIENEEDTGERLLSNIIENKSSDLIQFAKRLRGVYCYYLCLIGDPYGLEIAKELKIKVTDFKGDYLNTIKTKLQAWKTQSDIDNIKQPEQEKKNGVTFEDAMANAFYWLKVPLPRDITVKEWNAQQRIIKEIIKSKENGKS